MSRDTVVQIDNVSFRYPGQLFPILEKVSLSVAQNEFLGVVGPSGGGKTTLLKLMLGLRAPDSGTVKINGTAPKKMRASIGYVPQFARFRRNFPITVIEAVLQGRLGKSSWIGGYSREDYRMAHQALAQARAIPLAERSLETLSGGELQRVLFARAMASEPQILLLDEPTSNLDMKMGEDIFDLLGDLRHAMTIIVVSHDLGVISESVDRIACLNKSLVCHKPTEITGEVIQNLYGKPVHLIDHSHGHHG